MARAKTAPPPSTALECKSLQAAVCLSDKLETASAMKERKLISSPPLPLRSRPCATMSADIWENSDFIYFPCRDGQIKGCHLALLSIYKRSFCPISLPGVLPLLRILLHADSRDWRLDWAGQTINKCTESRHKRAGGTVARRTLTRNEAGRARNAT